MKMSHLSSSCRYYLFTGHTDMRKGFDSLIGIFTSQMNCNPHNRSVFTFFNTSTTRLNCCYEKGTGLPFITSALKREPVRWLQLVIKIQVHLLAASNYN
ncbi:hypothetical protein EXU57_24260 [Segetibacter sp. 3557_3]|uniref:IS66 family insertion sequence element accessory protein TnpB n=1 Tax=Segetibacter sp. 3557_3 TaxID=2547429 RepID=UPI001058A839|nr:hypothetical protein EXU57_24260 [Segetibacter sp. 3557_3]